MKKTKFLSIGLCFILSFVLIGATTGYGGNAEKKDVKGGLKVMDSPMTPWTYELTDSTYKNSVEFIEDVLSGAEIIDMKIGDADGEYKHYKKVKIGTSSHIIGATEVKDVDAATNILNDHANLTEETITSESGYPYNALMGNDSTARDALIKSPCSLTYEVGGDKITVKFEKLMEMLTFRGLVYMHSHDIRTTAEKDFSQNNNSLTKDGALYLVDESQEYIDGVKGMGSRYPIPYTIVKEYKGNDGNDNKDGKIEDVTLKNPSATIYAGGTKNTTAKAELSIPAELKPSVKSVTYQSSNNAVASVNNDTVAAKKKGSANINITLTLKDGTAKIFTQKITVKNATISFGKKTVKIKKGKKKTIKAKLQGHDPAKIKWSSSNKKIAKVVKTSKKGSVTIKGKKKGTVKLTAKIKVSNKKTVKKTFKVKVK